MAKGYLFFFFKSLLNLLQYCFCFMFFGPEACGILAPQPGIKPVRLALEGEVSTTGQPGKSWKGISLNRPLCSYYLRYS